MSWAPQASSDTHLRAAEILRDLASKRAPQRIAAGLPHRSIAKPPPATRGRPTRFEPGCAAKSLGTA
jgi:hypothetical protein